MRNDIKAKRNGSERDPAVTDWTNIEFSEHPKSRLGQDIFQLLTEMVAVSDWVVSSIAAGLSRFLVSRMDAGSPPDLYMHGVRPHDIAWGSLALALALRDPALAEPRRAVSTTRLLWSAEKRCILGFILLIGLFLLRHNVDETAWYWLLYWFAIFACMVAVSRWVLGLFLEHMRARGALRETIAVIGDIGPRNRLALRMAIDGNIVGVYGGHPTDQVSQEDISKLIELGRGGAVDSVVVAAEAEAPGDVAQLVERLKILPVEVSVCADQDWLQLPAPDIRMLAGVPVAVVADRPIRRRDMLLKTLLDKLGALALIVMFAPLMLAIAIAIWLTSEGPIIFRQKRRGWCGQDFIVFKFRTMVEAPSGVGWMSQTERNDVRCTPIGRFLRRTSLDELPQFWNVLLGDMSLVGPRPHAECLHAINQAGHEIVGEYAQRNRVKPGITGWAQIHGARGAISDLERLRQRVAYDLYYIENWSLWLDLQILVRTMFCLFGENAF